MEPGFSAGLLREVIVGLWQMPQICPARARVNSAEVVVVVVEKEREQRKRESKACAERTGQ